ncbi:MULTISPECIES: asparagine synthase (glutamine-hydrolyzing) [Campylobacter]|uniref:asparagine synthase (glutamine-hydrolyzing) n=1 Tax=Campylobacter TaxID=194 RepID=UPI001D144793|nr:MULTISPECIES: asparagine synthase (glutamine-hydrolyzing) [Campylobacter]UEB50858.1 asparagine synthase (glutamine-hydrolyzing) [Campylobacter curvus]
MCGIVGIINKNKKPVKKYILFKTIECIRYRGPDDSSLVAFLDNKFTYLDSVSQDAEVKFDFFMGHARLSILDLSSKGRQPFTANDLNDRYWIVFNGEIYNYIELRQQLIDLGFEFYTDTDTEVVLKAYIKWGEAVWSMLNGMWSIVIYDIKTKNIVISRDRIGEKPLYYFEDNNFIIFSSEIKQMLPVVDLTENTLETHAILLNDSSGYTKYTSFNNVFKFPSSHFIETNIYDFKFDFKRYWELGYDHEHVYDRVDNKKLMEYSHEFYDILYDAVKIRLRSDVDVSITLSGGLDSNTIYHIMKELLGGTKPINVFSSVFDDKNLSDIDESKDIQEALKNTNFNYNPIITDYNDLDLFLSVYREKTWAYDAPVPSIGFSGYSVYKRIKESNIKVVLEGQGADELLSGYTDNWFNFFRVFKFYKILEAQRYVSGDIKKLKTILKGVLSNSILSNFTFETLYKKILKKHTDMFNIELSNELFEYMLYRNNFERRYRANQEYNLNDAIIYSLQDGLPYLLYTGDRDSMMFSVESRLPYLDFRLLEFVVNLPENYKMHNGFTKFISRYSFIGKIPDKILWNKKKLPYPDASYYYASTNKELNKFIISILQNYDSKMNYGQIIKNDYKSVEKILSYIFFKEQFFNERVDL